MMNLKELIMNKTLIKNYFGFFKKNVQKIYEQNKWIFKPLLILTIIYIVVYSAIFRANYNYIDDMGRVAFGYRDWGNFSRFLSNFFAVFIHTGRYVTDISPLTQILASIILAISGIVVLNVFTGKKSFNVFEYASVLSIGLTPYFLECISYKFDSPYMALSIFSGVFPLLFYKKSNLKYCFLSIIGIIMVCTTYQPATGIYPMFVIILSFKSWINREDIKKICKFILLSIISYIIGLLLFKFFIMVPVNNYVSSTLSFSPKIILNNYLGFWEYIKIDFKKSWIMLIGIICFGFIVSNIINSKRNKIITFLLSLISLCLMILLCFGLYPFLEKPLFCCRAMYGLGIFISFVELTIASSKGMYISKICCLVLCWVFIVFCFTYGNALNVQQKYTDFRIIQTIEDLKNIDALKTNHTINIQIINSIGQANTLKNMAQHYPILNRLIPITYRDSSWIWGKSQFENDYGLNNLKWVLNLSSDELPIIIDNYYNTIRGKGNCILIELKSY